MKNENTVSSYARSMMLSGANAMKDAFSTKGSPMPVSMGASPMAYFLVDSVKALASIVTGDASYAKDTQIGQALTPPATFEHINSSPASSYGATSP